MAISDKPKKLTQGVLTRLKTKRKSSTINCRVCHEDMKVGDQYIGKPTTYSGSGYTRRDTTVYHIECARKVGIIA